jgi:hypothetical protein
MILTQNSSSQQDGSTHEINLDKRDFILDSKGICFTSHRPFGLYSEVVVTVELPKERIDLKGIVVGCQKSNTSQAFDITLFFHEQSPALQENIRTASRYLNSAAKAQAELLAEAA